MKVVHTFEEVRTVAAGRVGLVPTMGFLHEGHLSLIDRSASENDTTVVSVFVNPLQFGDEADLDAYPRDLERDVPLAEHAGADVLVAPTARYMVPHADMASIRVGRVGLVMEGVHRPGHFDGVATVVTKLFAGIDPDTAYFGRKDAQQVAVVTSLVRDLSFRTVIVGCPVIRERDGLALSSRNVRIADDMRPAAITMSEALFHAADLLEAGEDDLGDLMAAMREIVARHPETVVDYIQIADADTAEPMDHLAGSQFLAMAATVGGVRLIDAMAIVDRVPDRGITLDAPSILYRKG